MATITTLAIKVSADIADLTKGIMDVQSTINIMVKTAQNATPSLQNLEDVSSGLAATYDAVAETQKRVNVNP